MVIRFLGKKLSSFQIIIFGFLGLILIGTALLMLPFAVKEGSSASLEDALFTSTSAVCVTGLVVRDTASYWSGFGQAVILILIQIGGLGIVSVAAFIAMLSGRKITLLQRSMLQDSISAHQIGGIVKMTGFVFKIALVAELSGTLIMLPVFCGRYGLSGIGFLTWEDIATNKLHIRSYRMQSKVVLATTGALIIVPMLLLLLFEYTSGAVKGRVFLSLFQAITPRTAGFNTVSFSYLSGAGRMLLVVLMLIGGSPGSTAGGMKTTTIAVLFSGAFSVFRRKKSAQLFGRRIEEGTIRNAITLLLMYLLLPIIGAAVISLADGLPIGVCIFETVSAIGTVGLTLGITPSLSLVSRLILILFMFFGRAGGLTLIYAAVNSKSTDVSQRPVEKIIVG